MQLQESHQNEKGLFLTSQASCIKRSVFWNILKKKQPIYKRELFDSTIKIKKSWYIALFVVSRPVQKLFSIDNVNINLFLIHILISRFFKLIFFKK